MYHPHSTRFEKLPPGRVLRIILAFSLLFSITISARSQKPANTFEDTVSFDTLLVKKGSVFKYQGKTYKITKDTVFVIESYEIPTIEKGSDYRSKIFYDSVYTKLSRRKWGKMLYGLAFVAPPSEPVAGTKPQVKSEVPFNQYKGKVIRSIHICTLDPFGTSLYDTLTEAKTSAGKALNAAHIKSKSFVIRKNLFFREGQKVDPFLLADNERNIREMSYITIITKDVWSIGFDLTSASKNHVNFRIYDGNFLGLGDRLSTNFSLRTQRQGFFRLDGASYTFSNIGGTFIDGLLSYSLDDIGTENIGAAFNHNYYSINTKWAYGVGFTYTKLVEQSYGSDGVAINPKISYYDDVSLWGGRSFHVKNRSIPTRFVINESISNRTFSSRPPVSIDSNRAYYNTTRFLTGFSFSGNNYYLSDYIFYFGKTENVPYGQVLNLTLGPEINDFYTRLYTGVDFSAGNFINGFGYLSGSAILGGFVSKGTYQDCVIKMNLKYFTSLFMTPDKKYKFRIYSFADYRQGFNFIQNNTDYTNLNNDLSIDHVETDTVFFGVKSLSASLSLVMFSPINFYGFRFAFTVYGKGGFVAGKRESLFRQRLYAGVGLGVIIRNDNLIFPAFRISCYYYPAVPNGVPWWQLRFDQNLGFSLPDFNPAMPRVETLQN
jgi:hypothetical protein